MRFFLVTVFCLVCAMQGRGAGPAGLPPSLQTVVDRYLFIQQKLATDSVDGVPAAATAMETAMKGEAAKPFRADFIAAAHKLETATDLHTARVDFQDVSNDLIGTLAENHVQTGTLHAAYCPMVKAYWVQTDGSRIENPYYGSAMIDCGSFRQVY